VREPRGLHSPPRHHGDHENESIRIRGATDFGAITLAGTLASTVPAAAKCIDEGNGRYTPCSALYTSKKCMVDEGNGRYTPVLGAGQAKEDRSEAVTFRIRISRGAGRRPTGLRCCAVDYVVRRSRIIDPGAFRRTWLASGGALLDHLVGGRHPSQHEIFAATTSAQLG
jgi:hypothetical protein